MAPRPVLFALAVAVSILALSLGAAPETKPPEGLRDNTPQVHAFVGARIVVAAGKVIEKGTLVIRDGTIVAIGEKIEIPADARVWDVAGRTIYPGLIDAFSETAVSTDSLKQGAPYWNELVRPQLALSQHYKADADLNKKLRSQGVTARLIAPAGGIIKGTSLVATTGNGGGQREIVRDHVALHLRLTTSRTWGDRDYPNSPMGAVALARQAMYDGRWYRDAWKTYEANHNVPRPERNDALEALAPYCDDQLKDGQHLIIVDASDELFFLRADRFAREFGLNIAIRGSGDEYRRLEAIRATGRPVIVPLNFPKAPNVSTPEASLNVPLERLMDWDLAPENPARLEQAGVAFALTTFGLGDAGKLREAVRTAIERGLSEDAALTALTSAPAKLLGVENRLGSLEVGRMANFVIANGSLFAEKTKLLETWVDGQRFVLQEAAQNDLRGQWTLKLPDIAKTASGKALANVVKLTAKLTGEPEKLEGQLIIPPKDEPKKDAIEIKLDHLALRGGTLSASFAAKEFGPDGVAQLSAAIVGEKSKEPQLQGTITWPDGSRTSLTATRTQSHEEVEQAKKTSPDANDPRKAEPKPPKPPLDRAASFAVNYPLGEFGGAGVPVQSAHVLFKNATVWTCGEAKILEHADVLVLAGVIQDVGKGLTAPGDAVIIDCTGKHITPGIIDCHSHMATDGGINEGTQTITAEVRIGDFVDPDDITIYRQLAGGVTSANILHGSANTIGGQNQVIKLRWGASGDQMKFADAPPGIKFALGENVKQANWGDNAVTRYPQTRLGVEQLVIDEFEAARAYQQLREKWETTHEGLPPRRDLELDAIVEILDGKRWIHCHSYRQDEILALLRTLELYRVKIGSLQHILEGYKVAREMAQHGATGSSFADWWAYKFEVYDAIPYNGAIMHNAGIVVSFNSDDAEMGRHLNHEAAKAVKYGGVPREEALKFVTLNPAKQLRIDQWTGSLEQGKHADLVIWSADPLSCMSRCEQTWIDGRKYFDRNEDLARRGEVQKKRAVLIQKILASGAEMASESEADPKQGQLWPREDIYCGASGRGRR